ncbi:hypothetical protein GCM10011611_02890 [Aliidongia dinghuensis]|uniref:Uncharacterized protein n=1 Tax=Aliidongia dinghuensis TaxID=1867774 RepID=A0A8J2YPS5_9PROT|nr:hypothetical protein GCM10011611_02890 [Aliidongia dinghuensis]
MGKYYRLVYIPMPKLGNRLELKTAIRGAADGNYGTMDEVGSKQGWPLYNPRQNEIEEWGDWLLARFAKQDGGCHPNLLWHKPGTTPLSNVRAQRAVPAVLYIHCHGNSEAVGFRPLKLSPKQLAARLSDDGLAPDGNSLRIKLWSCHSASVPPGGGSTYLQLFGDEMRHLGYYNLDIFGYRGEVNVNGTDMRRHKQAGGPNDWKRAREQRDMVTTGEAPMDVEDADDNQVEAAVGVNVFQ